MRINPTLITRAELKLKALLLLGKSLWDAVENAIEIDECYCVPDTCTKVLFA
ncbi:hypothetical protein SAMN02745781_00510 [Vibrio gazogenes DSM 21264]|uniref:Uncharacterized protein n=1 Tax=Vibrio gazogenes DSM 21264 = NBRC 103151 TaxID=1123492 RepID=A0A1M4UN37_VIBGA|nr:hypothetical protein [Vibrio gazogenes]SHE58075.1 hypothetical protein SAMN02745781_00510 [Vibrio gazogenes DSM 21264] [Vibrio gazogenes DSM 21264 = NBRC 103151]SJN59395.1 hypothetical protein BQ6471_03446 [Vibrio gazogenes]